MCKKMSSTFAVLISIRGKNCCDLFVKLFLPFIWEETYISNNTSFPALSVFILTNV